MNIKPNSCWSLLIAMLFIAPYTFAQVETPEQRKKLFDELQTPTSDTCKARAYLQLANYYLDKTPTYGVDIDSTNRCIQKASTIMLPYGDKNQIRDIRFLQARRHIKNHDPVWGRKMFMEFISGYQVAGKKKEEGEVWFTFGIDLMRVDPFLPAIANRGTFLQADYKPIFMECMGKALTLATESNDKTLQAKVVAELASYYLTSGAYDEAEKQIQKLLPLVKATSIFKPYEVAYLQMTLEFWQKRDLVKVISLGLAIIKNANDLHCEADARPTYIMLARTYSTTGDKASALTTSQKYIEVCKAVNKLVDPVILHYYLSMLLREKDPDKEDALNLVRIFDPTEIRYSNGRKFTVAKSYAEVYTALKQFDLAEQYFTLAQKTADNAGLAERNEFQSEFGKLYYVWGKYDEAKAYFEATVNSNDPRITLGNLENAHLFLFKIDSARGDYKAAINHYKASTKIKDSLQNELMRKNIAELNIQYETEKKEKDIQLLNSKISLQHLDSINNARSFQLLKNKMKLQQMEAASKEKSIQLLNSQVKLEQYKTADKEKSILVLTGEAKLKESELKREKLAKNLMFIGSGLLLIILALLYNQHRVNKRNNTIVKKNNESLQVLLKDKEILMKEIHHRVKNNLQMVLSLLESQSAYLANDALTAIQSSYNRVLAMSLIHQKLYLTDNTTHIDMSGYLWELITYLQESFGTSGHIFFKMEVDHITLDIAQAVPLGLIVNESVTNAIKYAFPGNARGTITISMKENKAHLVSLHIHDDGIGLPDNFDMSGNNSLGLRLIKGLSDNLEAKLSIEKNNGTGITMEFYNSYMLQQHTMLT